MAKIIHFLSALTFIALISVLNADPDFYVSKTKSEQSPYHTPRRNGGYRNNDANRYNNNNSNNRYQGDRRYGNNNNNNNNKNGVNSNNRYNNNNNNNANGRPGQSANNRKYPYSNVRSNQNQGGAQHEQFLKSSAPQDHLMYGYNVIQATPMKFSGDSGVVTLDMDLYSFKNPDLAVFFGDPPKKFSCKYSEAEYDKSCMVYFAITIMDIAGNVEHDTGPVKWSDQAHQLDLTTGEFDFQNSSFWFGHQLSYTFPAKPAILLFTVYSMGNLIDSTNSFRQGAVLMEQFLFNLTDVTPSVTHDVQWHGTVSQNNELDFAFTISCDNTRFGSQCDLLNCQSVVGANGAVQCNSQKTNQIVMCNTVQSTYNPRLMDVDSQNCSACPPGVAGLDCINELALGYQALIVELQSRLDHFRTATIVLGVFFALAVLLLLVLVLLFCVLLPNKKGKKMQPVKTEVRSTSYQDQRADAARREEAYRQGASAPIGTGATSYLEKTTTTYAAPHPPQNGTDREWYRPDTRAVRNGNGGERRSVTTASVNGSDGYGGGPNLQSLSNRLLIQNQGTRLNDSISREAQV